MIELNNKLKQFKKLNKQNKKKAFFISNTSKNFKNKFYFTPIRETKKFIYFGCVLSDEKIAEKISKYIDGKIKHILVDTEKKSITKKKNSLINIERTVRENVKKSKIYYYRANDLTVNAAENFLKSYFNKDIRNIGGKNILIIGAGNIGFKLSLKLVEAGSNVALYSRNKKKLIKLIDTINVVKPKGTRSNCKYYDILKENLAKFDVIIGCANTTSVIKKISYQGIPKQALFLDIGKGLFADSVLEKLNEEKIMVYRLDVSSSYNTLLESIEATNNLNDRKYKIKIIGDFTLISLGILGKKNDLVVDDPENPRRIFGICDGYGDFKNLDYKKKKIIEKKFIRIFNKKLEFI